MLAGYRRAGRLELSSRTGRGPEVGRTEKAPCDGPCSTQRFEVLCTWKGSRASGVASLLVPPNLEGPTAAFGGTSSASCI